MEPKIEDVDAWVVARIGALERANRRLWVGVAASFTTLVSLAIAAAMFAAHLELPSSVSQAGEGGSLRVDELEVRRALRVVDGEGQTLISLGRDDKPENGPPQAVVALFANDRGTQQTIRLATSSLGSALSLASPDGGASSSLFAGASGVSLELRRGGVVRSWNEQREPGAAVAAAAPPPVPAPKPSAPPHAESEARAAKAAGDGAAVVDLTNPTLQAVGSGFLVGPSSVTDSSGGLRVRGRIVNATSVDQSRAEFRIALGSHEVSFTVARVSAGSSAPFAVELQAGGKADVRAAHMRWVRSNVAYGEE